MSYLEQLKYLMEHKNKLVPYHSEKKTIMKIPMHYKEKNENIKNIKFHNIHDKLKIDEIKIISANTTKENFDFKLHKNPVEVKIEKPDILYQLNIPNGISHSKLMKNTIETENGISNDYNRRMRSLQGDGDLEELKEQDENEIKDYEYNVESVIANFRKKQENYNSTTTTKKIREISNITI